MTCKDRQLGKAILWISNPYPFGFHQELAGAGKEGV